MFKDPNAPIALDLRERFPTPGAIAAASPVELRMVRRRNHPSEAQFVQVQQLATHSIGTKDAARQHSLMLEQALLIQELRLLQNHLERLEGEIGQKCFLSFLSPARLLPCLLLRCQNSRFFLR